MDSEKKKKRQVVELRGKESWKKDEVMELAHECVKRLVAGETEEKVKEWGRAEIKKNVD